MTVKENAVLKIQFQSQTEMSFTNCQTEKVLANNVNFINIKRL